MAPADANSSFIHFRGSNEQAANAFCSGIGRFRFIVSSASQRTKIVNSQRARQAAGAGEFAGRGDQEDDRPGRVSCRARRHRAGHRQSRGDDVRRAGPVLDHREPRVSAASGRPGQGPRQGSGRHRRRRQVDKFTVFAEGLNIPSGIAVGHGGVWVANSPDILFTRRRPTARTAGEPRSGRHRLRPLRHARAAQLAHLGTRRLALRPQRRLQPQRGRKATTAKTYRVHLRAVSHSSADARVPGLLRRDQQPLGLGVRHRGKRASSAPA